MDYLNIFDVLITDYSSIYFDYMLLERPMIFLPYDLAEYEGTVGFTIDYNKYAPGDKPNTFEEFIKCLLNVKNNPETYTDSIKKLNLSLNSLDKEPCKSLSSFIKGKI